jgi:AcrR family transcriptional regulator
MPSRTRSSSPRTGHAENRILDAVTELAASHGYGDLTVDAILVAASVSRASFYQYFANVDDCFWCAYRLHAERLYDRLCEAIHTGEHGLSAVLDVLARQTAADPVSARLLIGEPLAAGPRGLRERDALIARIGQLAGARPASGFIVDLPASLLIGGVFRFLTMSLDVPALSDQLDGALAAWCTVFRRAESKAHWGARFAPLLERRTARPPEAKRTYSPDMPRRERIIRATAAAVHAQGFHAVRVDDIVTRAGVSRRSFYNEFSDRTAAFVGAYEYAFERVLAVCAPAFFSSGSWPERVWASARAFTGFLAGEPDLYYLGFVESYAPGRGFSQRVNDTQLAFTLFLQEGIGNGGGGASASGAVAALTAVTIAEAGAQAARAVPVLGMRPIMPLAVYVALAPFLGSDAAGSFVAGKLAAHCVARESAQS